MTATDACMFCPGCISAGGGSVARAGLWEVVYGSRTTKELTVDIAVVIPTVGRPELQRAVNSVMMQTMPAAELIVVDNSDDPDATRRLVADLAPAAQFQVLPPRSGPAAARNCGSEASRSSWVAFLDDDDAFDESYLEVVEERLEGSSVDVVYTTKVLHDGQGGVIGTERMSSVPIEQWMDTLYRHVNRGVAGSNLVLSRSAFASLGGFDERLRTVEDREFAMRVLAEDLKVGTCDAVVHVYDSVGDRAKDHPHRLRVWALLMWRYRNEVAWATRRLSLATLSRALLDAGKRRVHQRVHRQP